MFKTILVPIDISHSESVERMLPVAKAMSGLDGSKIVLLNVIAEMPSVVAASLPPGFSSKVEKEARAALEGFGGSAGFKSEPKVEIRHGDAYHQILNVADEKKADLIIIASHRPVISDYLLGSTASRVVRHADCSVLVVRGR